jgi:hypothetical protein
MTQLSQALPNVAVAAPPSTVHPLKGEQIACHSRGPPLGFRFGPFALKKTGFCQPFVFGDRRWTLRPSDSLTMVVRLRAHPQTSVGGLKMFRGNPGLQRQQQTEDVVRNSLLCLQRALSAMRVASAVHCSTRQPTSAATRCLPSSPVPSDGCPHTMLRHRRTRWPPSQLCRRNRSCGPVAQR